MGKKDVLILAIESSCDETAAAVVKNGNVYYIGFYSKKTPELYVDIIRRHIVMEEPIDPNLEEVAIGKYRMYLNHGDYDIKHKGYDLLKDCCFDVIPAYGVVLIEDRN